MTTKYLGREDYKMYGNKLWITGITMILALPLFGINTTFLVAGAIIAVIGCIMVWLER